MFHLYVWLYADMLCSSWFTDHPEALDSSLPCCTVSLLPRVFSLESWDRDRYGFFCFDFGLVLVGILLVFFPLAFCFVLLLSGHNQLNLRGTIYNPFYQSYQYIYSYISLQILHIFCRTDFFSEGNSGGLFHTWHLQPFSVCMQRTMSSQYEGSGFVVTAYSAPIIWRIFLQNLIV